VYIFSLILATLDCADYQIVRFRPLQPPQVISIQEAVAPTCWGNGEVLIEYRRSRLVLKPPCTPATYFFCLVWRSVRLASSSLSFFPSVVVLFAGHAVSMLDVNPHVVLDISYYRPVLLEFDLLLCCDVCLCFSE